jgi:scyllo-inositol 2-dehydrogenase (NADP+)
VSPQGDSDLRGAVIGFGLAGSVFHAPLIEATPGLSVAAIVSSDPERVERARREHPDAEVLPSPDELFGRASDFDFLVVASPNEAHAPLALRAIYAGLPVLVDKPLAADAARARDVVKQAEAAGVLVTVFLNRRWDSDQLTLRKLLAEGRLGQVLRYESRFERWRPELSDGAWRESTLPEDGGGIALDLGPHLVDQAIELFGPVARVYAEIDRHRGGAGDDDCFLALAHESGTHSHLWMSVLAGAPGPRLRVLGDGAAFVVEQLDGQEAALRSGARPEPGVDWGAEPPERWGVLRRGDEEERVQSEPGAWPEFYVGFERAVREGAPPPVDPWDAVRGLEVLDAARESAAGSETVALS